LCKIFVVGIKFFCQPTQDINGWPFRRRTKTENGKIGATLTTQSLGSFWGRQPGCLSETGAKMRISDEEVKKIISGPGQAIVEAIVEAGEEHGRQQDRQIVESLTAQIICMADRDDVIEELRAQIASGQYNPSGEEIIDAMLRRAVADNVK
jgi:anti-sigma28 factor (negative regulator of flagellin synthesis)